MSVISVYEFIHIDEKYELLIIYPVRILTHTVFSVDSSKNFELECISMEIF